MNFIPVSTKAELDTLDDAEIFAGYIGFERGDPEPGPNRGKAYWHGWRNAAIDTKVWPMDEAASQLAHEVAAATRAERAANTVSTSEAP
jgi:hypothetical protein